MLNGFEAVMSAGADRKLPYTIFLPANGMQTHFFKVRAVRKLRLQSGQPLIPPAYYNWLLKTDEL